MSLSYAVLWLVDATTLLPATRLGDIAATICAVDIDETARRDETIRSGTTVGFEANEWRPGCQLIIVDWLAFGLKADRLLTRGDSSLQFDQYRYLINGKWGWDVCLSMDLQLGKTIGLSTKFLTIL